MDTINLLNVLNDHRNDMKILIEELLVQHHCRVLTIQGHNLPSSPSVDNTSQQSDGTVCASNQQFNSQHFIDQVIDERMKDSLVDWIKDDTQRSTASELFDGMKKYLRAKNGNCFRSDFDELLQIYLNVMDIDHSSCKRLGERVNVLKTFSNSSTNIGLHHRLAWGCNGILNVCNYSSHKSGDLSLHYQLQLAASVTALAECLPVLAKTIPSVKRDKERVSVRPILATDAEFPPLGSSPVKKNTRSPPSSESPHP